MNDNRSPSRFENWQRVLEGQRVTRCLVDYGFSLQFHDLDEELGLRIENAFAIVINGVRTELTPEDPAKMGPALALFGTTVKNLAVSTEGSLEISFVEG